MKTTTENALKKEIFGLVVAAVPSSESSDCDDFNLVTRQIDFLMHDQKQNTKKRFYSTPGL